MAERAGVPNSGSNPRDLPEVSRLRAAYNRGLRAFGPFFAAAVGIFVLTFIWFKRFDGGPMRLPLPEWIMLLPPVVTLGAGVIAGLVVMIADLVRGGCPPRGD